MIQYCVFCVNVILTQCWKNILFDTPQNGNDATYGGMPFSLNTFSWALTDALRRRFIPLVVSVYFPNLLSSFPKYFVNWNFPQRRAPQLEQRSMRVNTLVRRGAN